MQLDLEIFVIPPGSECKFEAWNFKLIHVHPMYMCMFVHVDTFQHSGFLVSNVDSTRTIDHSSPSILSP